MDNIDPGRWHRAKEVFYDALDASPESRASFVEAACGADRWLRDEVDSLLKSDDLAGDFIERPVIELLGTTDRTVSRLLDAGDTLGRYEILQFLGAGAVSEVYRARDTRLGRTVAVKLQTDATVADAGAWLLREAQHASTLNHPHICTVHEVEEVNGLPFIVLEHVEGQTLHAMVKAGSRSAAEIVRWGAQIAEALDHAHRRGIVHRDLKGSNVAVTPDGDVKVLDFGLARRLSADDATATAAAVLTDASVAGTLTHIAPEVLQGGSIDARMDIWAVGVVLYEMASGQLPFKGDTPFSTANAILETEPPPLPSGVPLGLQRVIMRCLSKNADARYQTASALRDALNGIRVQGNTFRRSSAWLSAATMLLAVLAASAYWLTGRSEGTVTLDPAARMLAVLPLRDTSGDESHRYLADGMTEALVAELGRFDAVRVIATSSTAKFRGNANAIRDVARETRAAHVLEGSIVRSNERVRLSARLIEAATGRLIWSEEYERAVRDLHALYGSVAAAIAAAVEVNLDDEDTRRVSLRRAVDPDVYEAYLKGRFYWNQRTSESLQTAVAQFEAAIALDPSYAPAYAALADCYNQLGTVMVGGGSPQEWRPRAADAAVKALQIDPGLAEAHATLGYVRHYSGDLDAAEKSLRRAIELNPSYALGRIWYANYLSSRGRADEAIRQVTLAQELDPLSPVINTNVAWVMINARRYDEAIVQLKRTLAMDSTYIQAHSRLCAAYSFAGRHDDAIAECEVVVRLSNSSTSSLAALAQAYGSAGRPRDAERLLDQLVGGLPARYVSSGAVANAYTALGRTEQALSWLERSYRERTNNIAYLAVEPVYDAIRQEPRFQAVLRAAGLP